MSSERWFFGFVLAFAGVVRCASADESLFDAGRRLQANGQFEDAEREYRAFLKQQPRSVPALTNLGVVMAHEGKFDAAITRYKEALRIDPAARPAKINLALAYYRRSNWTEAAKVLRDLVSASPDDRRTLQLLAICDMQLQQYGAAVREYRKLTPTDDPSVLVGLSSALREAGNRLESEKVLSSVLEQHPDSPEVQYLIGLAQFTRQDYDPAAISFKRMTELAPTRADGYFYLGATYLKRHDLAAALSVWKQAVEVDRQYLPATFAYGASLAEMNRFDEAEPFLRHALTERPDDVPVQLEMARLFLHKREPAEAVKLLKRTTELDARSKQASFLLATAYRQLGKEAEAKAEFARSRKLFSQDTSEAMLSEATKLSQERTGHDPAPPKKRGTSADLGAGRVSVVREVPQKTAP
jgi:tetratricopeptide (TPR) repeat protein